MSIAVPLYGFGASGGTGGTLTVTAPANVTVTVSKGGKTKTKNSGTGGVVVFKGLKSGTWTVTITGDGKTAQKNVVITTDYSTAISFNLSVGQQKVGTLFFASMLLLNVCIPVSVVIPVGVEKSHVCFKTA